MRLIVIGKVIPTSFLKIEGWGTFVRPKDCKKEEQLAELVGDHNPDPEDLDLCSPNRESQPQDGSPAII